MSGTEGWEMELAAAAATMAEDVDRLTVPRLSLDVAYVIGWLEGLAANKEIQLSSGGRRSLRDAAGTLSFLVRQADFQAMQRRVDR